MTTPLPASLRALSRTLAPAVALIALAAGLTGALHHHDSGHDHDPCAVCSVGSAPALTAEAAVAVRAPAGPGTRVIVPIGTDHGACAPEVVLSRGPPSA